MFWDQNLATLFQKGSFAMWPLLFCSVIGAAIILERGVYFLRLHFSYEQFMNDLMTLLHKKRFAEALQLCRKSAHPVPRMAETYLRNLDKNDLRQDILKRQGSFALEKVEKNLRALATITHLAPLLGLLGTVTGLVGAFHQIELLGGQVQPSDLASGIWEALITTVFGLVIAIPCMAAYHGFESTVDKIATRLQFVVSELDEFFGRRSSQDFRAGHAVDTEDIMTTVQ